MKNNLKLLKDFVRQSSTKSLQPKGLLEWELRTPTHSWNLDGGNVRYTSLRDVMSSVLGQCKQGSLHHEIVCCSRTPIKNRLVEQAARAYLQPTMVEHTKRNQHLTSQWRRFIHNTSIPFNLKDTFRRPIEKSDQKIFLQHGYITLSKVQNVLLTLSYTWSL
ncbi:hypothetical protein O6H91_03G028000 [Diphasiastrum complanatum]|uniref:Uncharacterized protein n=1 Tax=Diphasiastrum complanatum TaxID=34168 RepID=A0ACC2E4I8_DIPCM|nr:hypothetical protein O6H91_03G028000 [Diphasiastrum complanatum]